jgi:hypothetical protein
MKKLFMILVVLLTLAVSNKMFPQVIQSVLLNGNNIASWFHTSGVFNQDFRTTNTPDLNGRKVQTNLQYLLQDFALQEE